MMSLGRFPYLHVYKDRHGKTRYYYRRGKLKQRVDGDFGSIEFVTNYHRIRDSFQAEGEPKAAPGTVDVMVEAYYASPEFTTLKPGAQTEYRRYIESLRERIGKFALSGLSDAVIYKWRDKRADTPAAANSGLRAIKTMLNWAVKRKLITENPAKDIDPIRIRSDGWQPWPDAALEKFTRESKGAARVAFFLALYTGQRRADCLAMRWDAVKNGGIALKQQKTGKELWVPIHPTLAAELAKIEKKGLTIVQKENGGPYTDDGFGSIWNRAQHEFGCAGLPFHGLRKNACITLFEAGCSEKQVAAITGHDTLAMLQHYSRGASQKRLAVEAMARLTGRQGGDEDDENG